jgi:hypothetical protein
MVICTSRSTLPPSALPGISPTRGEIGCFSAVNPIRLAKADISSDLPPCGGDGRQPRGGRDKALTSIRYKTLRPHHAA